MFDCKFLLSTRHYLVFVKDKFVIASPKHEAKHSDYECCEWWRQTLNPIQALIKAGLWEFFFSADFLIFENILVPKFQLFLLFSAYFWHLYPISLFFVCGLSDLCKRLDKIRIIVSCPAHVLVILDNIQLLTSKASGHTLKPPVCNLTITTCMYRRQPMAAHVHNQIECVWITGECLYPVS